MRRHPDLTDYAWAGMAIFAVGVAAGILLFNQATRFRKGEVQRIAGRSSRPAKTRNGKRGGRLSRYTEKTKGKVSQEALQAVDPDTAACSNSENADRSSSKNASSRKIQADADQRKRRLGQCDQRHGPGRAGR